MSANITYASRAREHANALSTPRDPPHFPIPQRIYINGSQEDIRVPMREIQLSRRLSAAAKDHPQYEA